MKRMTIVAAATAATILGVGVAAALGLDIGDFRPEKRDVGGYQRYVSGWHNRSVVTNAKGQRVPDPQQQNYRWAAAHPDLMLAEGDRACDWLTGEPDPPLFGADESKYNPYAMTTRYLKTAAMEQRVALTEQGPRYVVAGAWEYLCPHTRDDKTMQTPDED